MTSKTYDILAYIGRIGLPACAALYGTLAGIWGLPYGEAIVATLSALAVFLNALLKVNGTKYERDMAADLREEVDRSDDAPDYGEV